MSAHSLISEDSFCGWNLNYKICFNFCNDYIIAPYIYTAPHQARAELTQLVLTDGLPANVLVLPETKQLKSLFTIIRDRETVI